MKKLLLAGLLALLPATARADEHWYMSHMGADTCVPLQDIEEPHLPRVYYGSGNYHTPQQIRAWYASHGGRIENISTGYAEMFSFKVTAPGVKGTSIIMMIKGKETCETIMRMIEK